MHTTGEQSRFSRLQMRANSAVSSLPSPDCVANACMLTLKRRHCCGARIPVTVPPPRKAGTTLKFAACWSPNFFLMSLCHAIPVSSIANAAAGAVVLIWTSTWQPCGIFVSNVFLK